MNERTRITFSTPAPTFDTAAPSDSVPPAAPEDVAWWAKQLRDASYPCTPTNIGLQCANMLESLAARNRALEGVIAEHNKRCELWCSYPKFCIEAGECADCPRHYIIEVPK